MSIFGKFDTVSDIALIFYFTSATIIGVYSIQPFKRIRPRFGISSNSHSRMGLQHIIANVTVLLVISSSWPALVRVLGLIRLDSAGPYEQFHKLNNTGQLLAIAFRLGVLITTVFPILDYYVLRINGFNGLIGNEISSSHVNGHLNYHDEMDESTYSLQNPDYKAMKSHQDKLEDESFARWIKKTKEGGGFRKRYKGSSDIEDEDEIFGGIDELVIIIMCAAGLAMAFAGFLLLPFTMIATALLHDEIHSENYYLSWLDSNLLVTLWNYTFMGCNFALFVLLPFAFFYNETDQLKTFWVKAQETATIMLLVGVLMYIFIYMSRLILGIENIDFWVILNLLTCMGGAWICLKATPIGYIQIFSCISELPLRPNYRNQLKDSLIENEMETSVLLQHLENVERGWKSPVYAANLKSRSQALMTATSPSTSESNYNNDSLQCCSSSEQLYSTINNGIINGSVDVDSGTDDHNIKNVLVNNGLIGNEISSSHVNGHLNYHDEMDESTYSLQSNDYYYGTAEGSQLITNGHHDNNFDNYYYDDDNEDNNIVIKEVEDN
ncbi:10551_t:CDS:2 [Entrophospora sp. SA101]|nr:10551_t:CDS:2 [Entrophospora sp. SA101]